MATVPLATSRPSRPPLPGVLRAAARQALLIDLRTLALFRVLLALMVIVDLAMRARDLTAHYSDRGVLPRSALIADFGSWFPSVHLMSGSPSVQAALFVVAGLVALALLVGYRTRAATVVSWLLLLSLQARNPAVSQGADMLLRVLLFWAMFLPLGARFSVDAALDDETQRAPNDYFSIATVALLVQVMSVYLFTALLKSSSAWIPNGTAVYYALQIDYLVTPIGAWLRQFPLVMQGLTYFVWGLEIAAPILAFSPVLHVPLRIIVLALLVGMHIGFFLCMEIGIFPFVSITSLAVLVPGWVWDRLGARLRTPERRGVAIYYDEPCEFCRKVCLLLRTFLLPHETPIRPAQHVPEIHEMLKAHNSWVVVDHDGSRHVRWDAVALVFRRSALGRPLGVLMARPWVARVGESIYATIATNRGRLAAWSAVALPYRRRSLHPSLAASAVIGALMILVLWVNLKSLPWFGYRIPPALAEVVSSTRLMQKWSMFAPAPSRVDGWYVIRGETAKGAPVDVLRGRPGEPDFARPAALADEYGTYRWRKYLVGLKNDDWQRYRGYYAAYVCRTYNARRRADDRLARITIYFNREVILPDYRPRRSEVQLVYEHECRARPSPVATDSPLGAGNDDNLP